MLHRSVIYFSTFASSAGGEDEAQVLAVGQLPRLWPIPPSGADQKNYDSGDFPSCNVGRPCDTTGAVSESDMPCLEPNQTTSSSPASPQGEGRHSIVRAQGVRRGTQGRQEVRCPPRGVQPPTGCGMAVPVLSHEAALPDDRRVDQPRSLSSAPASRTGCAGDSPAHAGSADPSAQPHADQRGTPCAGPFARVAPADDDRQPGLSPIDMLTPNERRAWAEFFRRLLGAALLAGAGLAMAASARSAPVRVESHMADGAW